MMVNCDFETEFNELITRIDNVFAGKLGAQAAKKYLTGLLSPIEHKNNWQISEALGETTPYLL